MENALQIHAATGLFATIFGLTYSEKKQRAPLNRAGPQMYVEMTLL
jgi:hypothetical protein